MKRIKGNTQRQRHRLEMNIRLQGGIEQIDKEVGIFEESEQSDINHDRHRQNRNSFLLAIAGVIDPYSVTVIEEDRQDHEDDVSRFSPSVED